MTRAPSRPARPQPPLARLTGPESTPASATTVDTSVANDGDPLLPLLTPTQAAELLAVRESWLSLIFNLCAAGGR